MSLNRESRAAIAQLLGYLVLTRALVFIAANCLTQLLSPGAQRGTLGSSANRAVSALLSWDAAWYLSVVERGYWFDPNKASNVAFFPGLPLLIKGVMAIGATPVAAGLIVANAAAVAGLIVFWRWVRAQADSEAAKQATLWVVVYPFAFFFQAVYAESLFFLLVTLALAAAGRQRWVSAGLWGAMAAATRPFGVLLAPALVLGLWRECRRESRRPGAEALGALLPIAGLGAYMVYLGLEFGHPLAFWTAHVNGWNVQAHWTLAWHWRDAAHVLIQRLRPCPNFLDWLRFLLPPLFVTLTVVAWRRLGVVAGAYSALVVAIGILTAPESVGREFLAAVPAFAAAGIVAPAGVWGEALRMCALGLLTMLFLAFAAGRFVG